MSSQCITNWFKPTAPSPSSLHSESDASTKVEAEKAAIGPGINKRKREQTSITSQLLGQRPDPTGLLTHHIRVPVIESRRSLELRCKELNITIIPPQNSLDPTSSENKYSFDESAEYEVESIVGFKRKKGKAHYLVKWNGWSEDFNSWEPADNLQHSKELIIEFHKNEGSKLPKLAMFRQSCVTKQKEMFALVSQISKNEDVASLLKLRGTLLSNFVVNSTTIKTVAKELRGLISKPPKNAKNPPLIVDLLNSANGLSLDVSNFVKARQKTMIKLREWEEELNVIPGLQCSIRVENHVDLEGPPENFTYITDYKAGEGITIPDDPPIGCECSDCYENKNGCCAKQSEGTFAYNKYGTLNLPFGTPIYECNKTCKCAPNCTNRVVQKGRQIKLSIFRTDDKRGWGVKTLEKIRKGAFVMEYIGEVITNEEAKNRDKFYNEVGRTYLLDLDYDGDDFPYAVDAAYFGNISHFMNHSCDPNLAIYGVWINNLDPKLPRIAFFAKRDIKTGEELTFDYQYSKSSESPSRKSPFHSSQSSESTSLTALSEKAIKCESDVDTSMTEPSSKRMRTFCRCKAENCRKYLF